MIYKINGKEYLLPSQLKEITLQQRIDYDVMYGRSLDEQKRMLDSLPESSEKEIELSLWEAESACKAFSFFTGIDLDTVTGKLETRQVWNAYSVHLELLLEEELELQLQDSYLFKGKEWIIVPPTQELAPADMTYKDFLMSKSVIKDLAALGNGCWDRLPALCAVYLRQSGETTDDVLAKSVERRAVMLELPLDIALSVGLYLKETMTLYLKTIKEYKPPETT